MNVIEINNLTKTYGKARGITDLSFQVEEGVTTQNGVLFV
jgi:ABC-2 type transport system ATP-binding protein